MRRAKRAKKRQAKTLSTPGLGIGLGIAMGATIGKFLMETILKEFGTEAVEQAQHNPEVKIDMGNFFDSMNVFIPLILGGRHRKIVRVRPSASKQNFAPFNSSRGRSRRLPDTFFGDEMTQGRVRNRG